MIEMEFKEGEIVYYAGTRSEVQFVNNDGTIQIKFRNANGQNRIRLVKASLLEKTKTNQTYSQPVNRGYSSPGNISNSIIRARNGGVRHQFEDSIGGCSSNYR